MDPRKVGVDFIDMPGYGHSARAKAGRGKKMDKEMQQPLLEL